jgi:hypothetical protein
LVFTPGVVPCTVTLNVQEPLGASVAPDRLTVPDPATAVMMPGAGASVAGWTSPRPATVGATAQAPVRPFGLAIINPAGSTSENPTALRKAGFGLWIVKLSEVVPLDGMLPAPNALVMVGGSAKTVRLAVAAVPEPP